MQGSYLSEPEAPVTDDGTLQAPDLPDEDALKSHFLSAIADSEDFVDSELANDRATATKYYNGEKFGNEQAGRSQIVLTEVRDTIQAILPSLMRVFFGSERVVEFIPSGPEDIATAEQATDYINYIVTKDNPGFEVMHAAFKDALKSKLGIIKWWWDEDTCVTSHKFSGLDEQAVMALLQEPGVEVEEATQGEDGLATLKVKKKKVKARACIAAVPPEEFLFNRRARSLRDAAFICHRSDKTRSDLVSMGYSDEELDGIAFRSELNNNEERLARSRWENREDATEKPKANNVVTYYECWGQFDFDGDGMAELMRVCIAGNRLLHYESTDEIPFAVFCPDPEPHKMVGLSVADYTMDIQLIKSTIFRNMLDSLAQSIHQRMGAVEGQVNMDDLMNNEVGGIVRMRAPGMVQPLDTPFVGQQAFPMLAYMDEVREQRTGMSKASQGLDADALQSTTRAAVQATVTKAQEHIELIARIFAETGMKDLYRGLLRLTTRHQDQQRMVRLRNQWVPVDPRSWDVNMDVGVNVALGYGTSEDRLNSLMAIAAKQEQMLQLAGVDNPLVSISNLHATYTKMCELAGWKDPTQFFSDPEQWEPPPPKPDPAEMLAQVQMEDIRASMAMKAAEIDLKRQDATRKDDLERDKLDADIILRSREIEAKYNTAVDVEKIKAEVAKARPQVQAA
jgi:hypothetical protein